MGAALAGDEPEWLAPITDHIRVSPNTTLAEAVDQHVLESVAELRAWLAASDLAGAGTVVAGGAYQLASGEVHWL